MKENLVQRTGVEIVQPDPSPRIQDGGYEIHSGLKGITFYFWDAEKFNQGKAGQVYLTADGGAKEPWATTLVGRTTGRVYDGFSTAKDILRKKANELAGDLNG